MLLKGSYWAGLPASTPSEACHENLGTHAPPFSRGTYMTARISDSSLPATSAYTCMSPAGAGGHREGRQVRMRQEGEWECGGCAGACWPALERLCSGARTLCGAHSPCLAVKSNIS